MAAVDELINAIKQTQSLTKATKEEGDATDTLTKSMSAARSLGGAFSKVLGTIASVGKVALAGLGAIGALLGGITQGLLAPVDAIKDMADAIIQLVALANPGAVQQFTLALNDAMAVIGAGLTPVLEGMTIAMRAVGDVLAGFAPILQPVFDQIGQYLANWAVGFKGIAEAAAPLIDMMAVGLVEVLKDATIKVGFFQGALIELLSILSGAFAIDRGKFNKDASSQGAALRQYRTSSVDQFSKDLFAKQLSVIGKGGQGKTPEQNMEAIRQAVEVGQKAVREIADYIKSIYTFLTKDLPNLVRELIPDLPSLGDVTDAASGGGISGIVGALAKNALR